MITREITLDPVEVVASRSAPNKKAGLPVYRATETRTADIVHTDLDLRFDWERQAVLGEAVITLKPFFHPVDTIELDALHFDIRSVTSTSHPDTLAWHYNDSTLSVILPSPLSRGDPPVRLRIAYTAYPAKGARSRNGAISSDQGLYFIDPSGEDPSLPRQIWTQGETENNRRWFPTIDHPNEKMTHRVMMTVKDHFKTLSNGILESSVPNTDGTRTDTWVMDQPHAPYLVMVAVGDFAVEEDLWKGLPVMYYVDPEYASSARMIFNHTVEMLEFFSQRLGYPYPWKKYAQVVVRDFVSGAMENTTAVVFGDFVQDHADHFLVGNENDYIVAHEMIHHWFGDLVTCESWANLTLNEGFANYGEYLWFEYKYGKEEADHHRIDERNGYFGQAAFQMHPLIHFSYDDKDDMFDAHSYNKGGLVLHMLRNYLGDEAFFEGIRNYLEKHAWSAVEVHDLRLAFEEVCGLDLNWFFNQWYLSPGHPVLEYAVKDRGEKGVLRLQVSQVQEPGRSLPVFRLPLTIGLIAKDGKLDRKKVWMEQRQHTFEFRVDQPAAAVLLDVDDVLLARVRTKAETEENRIRLQYAPALRQRTEALISLIREEALDEKACLAALADPHWSVRSLAIESLDMHPSAEMTRRILDLARHDPDVRVRLSALEFIASKKHPEAADIAAAWLEINHQTDIVFTCLQILVESDLSQAREVIGRLDLPGNEALLIGKAMIYSADGIPEDAGFFMDQLPQVRQYLEPYLEQYFTFFGEQADPVLDQGVQRALDQLNGLGEPYLKYVTLREFVGFLDLLGRGKTGSLLPRKERQALYTKTKEQLDAIVRAEAEGLWKSEMENLMRGLEEP